MVRAYGARPAGTHVPEAWRLWRNPILRACARERLRPRSAWLYGGVTFAVAAFLSAEVFLTLTERGLSGSVEAAGSVFRVIFVLQALILMLIGTGSVAGGLAEERERGLVDYHRMTPMSPAAKILGYLFGLASREYLMVAVTLPFTVVSAILAQLPAGRVLPLYLVLATSVWLYHMTGLVAGMVARRPRRANWVTRLAILAVYLFLPQLGSVGFTFLGYLTVMPAYGGLLGSYLGGATQGAGHLWQDVSFFTLAIPPTLYTLLVQGLLLLVFFWAVRRKWRQESLHTLSKGAALVLFLGLQVLILGSLWSVKGEALALWKIMDGGVVPETPWIFTLYAFLLLSGSLGALFLVVVTPSPEGHLRGLRAALRRARRAGCAEGSFRISWHSDEAQGGLFTAALGLLMALGTLALLGLAMPGESLRWAPSPGAILLLLLLVAGIYLKVQTLCAIFGSQGFWVLVGAGWIAPGALAVLFASAFEAYVPAGYLAAVTPPGSLLFVLFHLFAPALESESELAPLFANLPGMLALSVMAFVALPALGQVVLFVRRRRLAAREALALRESAALGQAPALTKALSAPSDGRFQGADG